MRVTLSFIADLSLWISLATISCLSLSRSISLIILLILLSIRNSTDVTDGNSWFGRLVWLLVLVAIDYLVVLGLVVLLISRLMNIFFNSY